MRVTHPGNYDEPRDAISHDWLGFLGDLDMTPFPVPNDVADPAAYLAELKPDLLILTGGEDLGKDRIRDETEARLLSYALEKGLGVFGVCRGMQLINTFLGGTLEAIEGHVASPHSVLVTPPWQQFYGASKEVNSFHNLGITATGTAKELAIGATDDNGNVEGLYHPEKPLAAVMWHPERKGGLEGDQHLMTALFKGHTPWR